VRVVAEPISASGAITGHRGRADRFGDLALYGITLVAALVVVATIVFIIYQLIDGARPALSLYGLGFVGSNVWNPAASNSIGDFGAAALIYGTAVTSAIALLVGGPIAIAIGLFLSLLAPRRLSAVFGPLVELIAAIPSVVLGLWGALVLAPVMASTIEPFLHNVFGWIPLFGEPNPTGHGMFTAGVVLTIMVVPIIASISRELFMSVPNELQDGALALGVTRWEMVRGVVLSSTRAGLSAALILGLGRALGEAIAVSQVIGSSPTITHNLFANGDTLAARIATDFLGALSARETASLFYLALILLVIGLVANLTAQLIVRRYELSQRPG
jgi:phosphate transport system permease protein